MTPANSPDEEHTDLIRAVFESTAGQHMPSHAEYDADSRALTATDDLGNRMKSYEVLTRTSLPRRSFSILRVDGRCFSQWTRGLDRPFDEDLAHAMDDTARRLTAEVQGAIIGFVESDEISVVYADLGRESTQAWFGGEVQKQVSIAAATATAAFAQACELRGRLAGKPLATFDARVFTVPSAVEAANYLIWRQRDAERNSISMAAQAVFSHRQLQGVGTDVMQGMLRGQGVDWDAYPARFKRGGVVTKQTGEREVEFVHKRTGEQQTVTAVRSWWEVVGAERFTVDSLLPLIAPEAVAA